MKRPAVRTMAGAALAACAAAGAFAQQQSAEPPQPLQLRLDRGLELRLGAQRVSGDLGDWRERSLWGSYRAGAHLLQAELASQRRFGDSGTYGALTDTVTLDADWFASLTLGAGDGAFFLPRYRADAFVHRKLLPDRRLVASLGVGYYRAPDGHIDRNVTVGGANYFAAPWVVQAAVRFNESDPGSVRARQQFVAVTYGRERDDLVVGRYGWGRESYLAIGPARALVDFASREASIQWRHWFDARHGIAVGLEHYRNPLYERSGGFVSWIVDIP